MKFVKFKNLFLNFFILIIGFLLGELVGFDLFKKFFSLLQNSKISPDGLLGAFGNLTGGLIGALIAYWIAQNQLNNEHIKIKKQHFHTLRLISKELNSNINILEKFQNELLNNNVAVINLLSLKWIDQLPHVIPLLDDEHITCLFNYSNTIKVLKECLISSNNVADKQKALQDAQGVLIASQDLIKKRLEDSV